MMNRTGQGGAVMPDEVAAGEKSTPVLRTLADKVNWLIDRAHPAGRGPFSNNEIAALIKNATGRGSQLHHHLEAAQRPGPESAETADRGAGQDVRRPSCLLLRRLRRAGRAAAGAGRAPRPGARCPHQQRPAPRDPRAQPASPAGDRQPGRGHGTRRCAQAAQRTRRSRLNYPPCMARNSE